MTYCDDYGNDRGPKWVCGNCGEPSGETGHLANSQWACIKFNPGSQGAIEQGCTCPRGDNCGGRGYMGCYGSWVIRLHCPLHGSEATGQGPPHQDPA